MSRETDRLLRRADPAGHAAKSRRLRAGVHVRREDIDPGFVDTRIPGTCLEFMLPAGGDPMIVPMHSPWIALSAKHVRTTDAPTILTRFPRDVAIPTGPRGRFPRVRYVLAYVWQWVS